MNRNLAAALSAVTLSLTLAAPAHAYKIGGGVEQNAAVGNVITSSVGASTYARTDINTIYDGGEIGGSVKQNVVAKNVITSAVGYKSTACTSLNVIGQKDCSMR